MAGVRVVLGLDPGSRRTGYGVLRSASGSDGITRIASGTIRLDDSRPFAERLPELRESVNKVIHAYHPEEAVLETCFVSRGVRAALVLGHVRGVLLLLCLEAGLQVYEYAPSEVKRAVTGTGAASKPQVENMLRRLIAPAPEQAGPDEHDALAIAYCHLSRSPKLSAVRPLRFAPDSVDTRRPASSHPPVSDEGGSS
jgi:crossover junction endodeoxyribonuclease RuvC